MFFSTVAAPLLRRRIALICVHVKEKHELRPCSVTV